MSRTLEIADLFCGAGGTSTGALDAARSLGYVPKLTAVNHWDTAVATHTANHPDARHVCASVDSVNPRHLYPSGKLDLLWASPECTHHSRARGGKPMQDQSRASGHCVTRWAEALRPDVILVENVREFLDWGPLGENGRPVASKKGATFRAWVGMLESLGYRVDWRILCAADFGDPTSRERLFVQAVRGRRKIVWPEPTHRKGGAADLFGALPGWRGSREIIDWSLPSQSIFERKRPLAPKTMLRIRSGLERFGLGAFIVSMENGGRVISTEQPINTITTARGGAHGLVEAFLLPQQTCGVLRPVSDPAPTVSTAGAIGLVSAFLVQTAHAGPRRPLGMDEPLPTVAGNRGDVALCEPFLVEYYGNGGSRGLAEPMATVTTKARFGLVQPEVRIGENRYFLDLRFRMLQPHELASANGFPKDYRFTGTKTEVVKQIGNAVPCGLSRALVSAIFRKVTS